MEFSRQKYWCGVPFPSPGDLPDPGIEPGFPALQADSVPPEPPGKPTGKSNSTGQGVLHMFVNSVNQQQENSNFST